MSNNSNDPLSPQHVDETIDHLLSTRDTNYTSSPQGVQNDADTQLLYSLRDLYGPEHTRYDQAVQRVEGRLLERYSARRAQAPTPLQTPVPQKRGRGWWQHYRQGRGIYMDQRPGSQLGIFARRASIAVVVLLLIGTFAVVFNVARQRTQTGGQVPGAAVKKTPTKEPAETAPAHTPLGKTLYTSPSEEIGFNGIAWSHDSKRVATSSGDGVQIWDALDGKHRVTVTLPATGEMVYGLDWSPTSQEVAIATNQNILLVDGQSGKILRTHPVAETAFTTPSSTGHGYLSSSFPASGGQGFRAASWSPNGHLIASALSRGPYAEVQVWDARTGATSFSLKKVGDYYDIGSLAWSADGMYLAASAWNTQNGAESPQLDNQFVVWEVATQKVVFQQKVSPGNRYAEIAWQPQTHHLAYSQMTTNARNETVSMIKVWDIPTGKLVKQFTGIGADPFTWSPDGKRLVCTDSKDAGGPLIVLLDASSGKTLFVYKEHKQHLKRIAWSPNGKYIASAEGQRSGQIIPGVFVAKVWTAK